MVADADMVLKSAPNSKISAMYGYCSTETKSWALSPNLPWHTRVYLREQRVRNDRIMLYIRKNIHRILSPSENSSYTDPGLGSHTQPNLRL